MARCSPSLYMEHIDEIAAFLRDEKIREWLRFIIIDFQTTCIYEVIN